MMVLPGDPSRPHLIKDALATDYVACLADGRYAELPPSSAADARPKLRIEGWQGVPPGERFAAALRATCAPARRGALGGRQPKLPTQTQR